MKVQLKIYLLLKDKSTFLHVTPIKSKSDAISYCHDLFISGRYITKAYYCIGSKSFDLRLPRYFGQRLTNDFPIVRFSIREMLRNEGIDEDSINRMFESVNRCVSSIGLS